MCQNNKNEFFHATYKCKTTIIKEETDSKWKTRAKGQEITKDDHHINEIL
jgi:hypothetical protein